MISTKRKSAVSDFLAILLKVAQSTKKKPLFLRICFGDFKYKQSFSTAPLSLTVPRITLKGGVKMIKKLNKIEQKICILEGSCDTKDWSNDAKNSNIGSLKICTSKYI